MSCLRRRQPLAISWLTNISLSAAISLLSNDNLSHTQITTPTHPPTHTHPHVYMHILCIRKRGGDSQRVRAEKGGMTLQHMLTLLPALV